MVEAMEGESKPSKRDVVYDWRFIAGYAVVGTCGSLYGESGRWPQSLRHVKDENPFHDAGPISHAVQGTLEQCLVYALDLNIGVITIEIADFLRRCMQKIL